MQEKEITKISLLFSDDSVLSFTVGMEAVVKIERFTTDEDEEKFYVTHEGGGLSVLSPSRAPGYYIKLRNKK